MHQYRLPEELDNVSQQQADSTRDTVEQELDALDTVINEAEQKRRGDFYTDAYQRQRGYDELYRHGFGKTVVIDTELEGRLSFRVSQATSDYASTRLGFATPNSPLGKLCRIAKLGMSHESPKWGSYTIVEIRNFARYSGKDAAEHIRNFRVMESQALSLGKKDSGFNAIVSNLRAALGRWFADSKLVQIQPSSVEALPVGDAPLSQGPSPVDMEFEFDFDEPVILDEAEAQPDNQYDIFGRSEQVQDDYYGLSTYFFLNPTDEQLEIMTNSAGAGPMLVEGVAGSGKTCAALGRAKTLCDLARSTDDEQFNSDFLAESSIGFVRTGELVQYLRASCLELDIGQFPVEEYASLVYELSQSRNLLVELRKAPNLAVDDAVVLDDAEQEPINDMGDSADSTAVVNGKSQTRFHHLGRQPDYDFRDETSMAWLRHVSAVIGWRIADDLQQQLVALSLPENIQSDKFIAKNGNADTLLALVKERLSTYYQPILAQLREQTTAPFALDRVISKIYQAHRQLERELFDRRAKWVNPSVEQWRTIRDDKAAVALLRSHGVIFVEYKRHLSKAGLTGILVEVKEDLLNLIHQGVSIFAADEIVPLPLTDIEQLWSSLQQEGPRFIGEFADGLKVSIIFAKDFDDLNMRIINKTLLAKLDKRIFNITEASPFCRQILAGQKSTSLEKVLKNQLQRIYRKWQFAELYRDAMLQPYHTDKPKADTVKQRLSQWQDIADRLKDRLLAEHDKDLLLSLAHIMTRDLPSDAPVPVHMAVSSYNRSVFIDEVQDFTEQQIFLMAEQADPKYHAVTLVGDMHQQLGRGNVRDIEACFPYRPLSRYLLKENKRQERAPQLAATAMLFRALVQQDSRLVDAENIAKWQRDSAQGDSRQFYDVRFDGVDELLLDVIERQPHGRTIAVVCPEKAMAISLEARLREPLASRTSRSSHVADRIDLAKKYMVHFSCAEHVKGLEFDTLIYAGLEHIDWDDALQLNKIYVTLSRPRKQLVMFGDSAGLPAVVQDCLLSNTAMENR